MGQDPDWSTAKEVDRRFGRLGGTAGPRGLPIRRRDEQALIRPYVTQQLKWEENRDKRFCCSGPSGSDFVLAVTVISDHTEKGPQRRVPAQTWYKNSGT
jgi:hypothetical protein